MRQDRISVQTLVMAVFLGILISFSCVMCLNDAFALQASPMKLLTVCGAAACLSALSCVPKRSWPFGLLLAVTVLALILLKREGFLRSLETVVYGVTAGLATAFDHVQVIGVDGETALWVLAVLSVPLAWLTVWVIGREGSAAVVVLAVLPVLVLVLLVVDLAPIFWLILLTGGLLLVVMSQSVRERSRSEGSALAWWLVLPTVILLCAVTVLWPPADYVRADWSQSLQQLTQKIASAEDPKELLSTKLFAPQIKWSRELKTVDLRFLGPKSMTGQPVLQYKTDGKLSYLRGVSLAVYEDNSWTALDPEVYASYEIPDEPLLNSAVMTNTLEVSIPVREPQLYTAYYLASTPEQGGLVDDAYVQNMDRATAYRIQYEPYLQYPAGTSRESDRLAKEVYLQVPDTLRTELEAFAGDHGLKGVSAQTVAEFLRSYAVYDLNTPSIPAGEDFVLYFLQESRQGYCVHFASAAVLLLRTVGIPARYVTGYAVSGETDQWNWVTEDTSHAWAEYYTEGVGWRPLEPTPADDDPISDTPTEPDREQAHTDPSVQTESAETELPAEPAETEPQGTPQEKPLPLWWILFFLGAAALIVLRRLLALQHRRKRCEKGHPNRRTMAYWRWLVQLCKAEGTSPEEPLLRLAEKACFSQHTIEEAEIAILRQAAEQRVRKLKSAAVGKQLWWKYGQVLF